MRHTVPLGDGWQLRGCLGDVWRWQCGPGRPPDEPGWFGARVPGSVLDDLHRAGQVPDPYRGTQSLACEWVPQRTWLYRRELRLPAPLEDGERALLRFGGVDHECTVLLDGREVAAHKGMFLAFDVDVTAQLADVGTHLLAVAVHPAPPSEPQVGRTDRVREHKSRMGYGWDFCPRMVHQGIWRPVTLEVAGPLRLVSAAVGASVDETGRAGLVRADAVTEGGPGTLTATVRDPSGTVVAQGRQTADGRSARTGVELSVPEPALWWPNGHGEQPLYRVELTLLDEKGGVAGTHSAATGFRRLRLVTNPGGPVGALPYTLEVNGRRIHTKGWNWVPVDAQYGVPRPQRLEHLLRLAADAHVTLLRVWGGGLVESEDFYRLCDRLGILVWQEFSLSSSGIDSVPADDAAYVRLLEREARALLPPLRHHPALAVWGPGNELHDTAAARPLTERDSPAVAALAAAVAEADPSRAWLPGSPSGRDFLYRPARGERGPGGPDAQHDVHGPWEHQGPGAQQELYDAQTCLLHSEFGVEGMANARTWEHVVPPDARWPTGRDNFVMEHLGAWWNNTPLVRSAFGERPADVATMRRASRQLQYDGLRYAVEATLRRAPRAAGSIPWQFNEPFPNAWCTAAVDHRGDPKSGYHAVRRAYRPAHVCARFATQVWQGRERFEAEVWSWQQESPRQEGSTVAVRLMDTDGTVHAEEVLPAGEPAGDSPPTSVPAARAGDFTASLAVLPGPLFLLDLELRGRGGRVLARSRWLHSRTADLAPLTGLPEARVEARLETAAGERAGLVRLRHLGGPAALGLYLTDARPYESEGWAVFSDNMLDLAPREYAEVEVAWRAAPPEGRTVRLEGWNVRDRQLL
ncbi:glycoside hydrolase family 2 protein [Streptomyces daqingensis]|uniref:glycoside hydrolase family 2 protein n=1 Tax=Streptomyces daqingensis TaxID=1472640 RepID=UPI001669C711|nr:hypothetical protein [Streptomyces daqingensis]